jgi:hypothetical protein
MNVTKRSKKRVSKRPGRLTAFSPDALSLYETHVSLCMLRARTYRKHGLFKRLWTADQHDRVGLETTPTAVLIVKSRPAGVLRRSSRRLSALVHYIRNDGRNSYSLRSCSVLGSGVMLTRDGRFKLCASNLAALYRVRRPSVVAD